MRRKIIFWIVVCIGGVFVSGFFCAAGRAEKKVSPQAEGEILLSTHCARCHSLDRVDKAKEKYDRLQWEAVVDRMIKKGARLSKAERKKVLDYLAGDE